MNWHLPADFGIYDLIRDGGSLVGALVALLAAFVAYLAVRAQIREAQREDFENRKASQRAEERQKAVAATLVSAALEMFRYDLDRFRNTFDPGEGDPRFDAQAISQERASWLRQRLRPLIFEPLLQHVGRLNEKIAQEYMYVASISQRLREDDSRVTNEELRRLIVSLRERTTELRKIIEAASKN